MFAKPAAAALAASRHSVILARPAADPRMYTNKQTRYLRSLAHPLKPVVRIGQRGITPAVAEELEQALLAHELLKVKIEAGDRTVRKDLIRRLCESSGAHLVQSIGNIAVMYRRNDQKPKIELP